MATKNVNNKTGTSADKPKKDIRHSQAVPGPWISMNTGLKILTVTSLFMAVLTAIQVIPSKGLLMGIVWGLIFGALIWGVFFLFQAFNRIFKR